MMTTTTSIDSTHAVQATDKAATNPLASGQPSRSYWFTGRSAANRIFGWATRVIGCLVFSALLASTGDMGWLISGISSRIFAQENNSQTTPESAPQQPATEQLQQNKRLYKLRRPSRPLPKQRPRRAPVLRQPVLDQPALRQHRLRRD